MRCDRTDGKVILDEYAIIVAQQDRGAKSETHNSGDPDSVAGPSMYCGVY